MTEEEEVSEMLTSLYQTTKLKGIPQYVCQKTMAGLLDMYRYAGNRQAPEIVLGAADWFYRYTEDITPAQMAEMMWEETGGMMELFADLYSITGEQKHLELMRRYERKDLFDLLEAGENPLVNMHANSSVPENANLAYLEAKARGMAGMLFYAKIVGAFLEQENDVEAAKALFEKVRDATRTYSVAFTQCTHPITGMKMVDLPENEIEMGMGVHGEGGGENRIPMPSSRELAEKTGSILLEDSPYEPGDELLVFLNGLGSATVMELSDNPGTRRSVCLSV